VPTATTRNEGAAVEVVEVLDDGRTVLRFTSGPLAGRQVVAFPPDRCPPYHSDPPPRPVRRPPHQRAEELLLSLLNPEQSASWNRCNRFWVETPYGTIQFGEIHNMLFKRRDGAQFRLCVVPQQAPRSLPLPDVWVNLLLAIKVDPKHFFTVANWRRPKGSWRPGPVPDLEYRRGC
jgi:hypothetical protein